MKRLKTAGSENSYSIDDVKGFIEQIDKKLDERVNEIYENSLLDVRDILMNAVLNNEVDQKIRDVIDNRLPYLL